MGLAGELVDGRRRELQEGTQDVAHRLGLLIGCFVLELAPMVIADQLLGGDHGLPMPLLEVRDPLVLLAQHPRLHREDVRDDGGVGAFADLEVAHGLREQSLLGRGLAVDRVAGLAAGAGGVGVLAEREPPDHLVEAVRGHDVALDAAKTDGVLEHSLRDRGSELVDGAVLALEGAALIAAHGGDLGTGVMPHDQAIDGVAFECPGQPVADPIVRRGITLKIGRHLPSPFACRSG